MKFIRGCLIACAFVAFPLSVIVLADSLLVERETPGFLGTSAAEVARSPQARAELVEELGDVWLEERPELAERLTAADLDPEGTLRSVFEQLAQTEAFVAEMERGATQFGEDLVSGRRPLLRLDFTEAIEESAGDYDPSVMLIMSEFAMTETMVLSDSEALSIQSTAAKIKLYSIFVAAISFLLLALLTLSVRHHIGSLFFVGMPALFLQRFALDLMTQDPDPSDAIVGGQIADTWLPWTHHMMIVSAAALVILLVSYKLMPPTGSEAVPYAKPNRGPQPRPDFLSRPEDDSYDFATEHDHESLRQLSIVED